MTSAMNWKENLCLKIRWKLKYTFKLPDQFCKNISFLIYWAFSLKLKYLFQKNNNSLELNKNSLTLIDHQLEASLFRDIDHTLGHPSPSNLNWNIVNNSGLQENLSHKNLNMWHVAHHQDPIKILGENTLLDLIDNIFGPTLKAYYHSHYRILNIGMYISRKNNFNKIENSFLWHIDNHPPGLIKGFIYLTDTDMDHGPFTCLPSTHRTNHSKHQDKSQNTDFRFEQKYIDSLKIPTTHITGNAGTAFLVNANAIHRAYPVSKGERRVLTFMFLPSIYSPTEHYKHYQTIKSSDSPDRIHEPVWRTL